MAQTVPQKPKAALAPTVQPEQVEPPPVEKKVTAILITRNQAAELRRAVAALELSTIREHMDILAVDCGSTDDIRRVGDEHPGLTMLYLPDDFGSTKALNIAVRTAKTDLLFFVSPDVEVAPDSLELLMERLASASDTAAACPLLVNTQGQPAPLFEAIPTRASLAQACAGGAPPSLTLDLSQESVAVGYPGRYALLLRKQFIIGMNYFDERCGEYWAAADLAMRIHRAQRKIRVYPAIRAVFHDAKPVPDDVVHASDKTFGAARLLGKYDGFLSGFSFSLSAIFRALGRFDFSLLGALLGGKKIGSHAN